jgi:hypothetical protein
MLRQHQAYNTKEYWGEVSRFAELLKEWARSPNVPQIEAPVQESAEKLGIIVPFQT